MTPPTRVYRRHLNTHNDLVTTYEATRAGFVALALEKNRRATPFVAEARALQTAASAATSPADLLDMPGIRAGLLTASGLSDKSLAHLTDDDKRAAIQGLIENFLEPAGKGFVEELVFRFLLIRGDTLGGSMRNFAGQLAQQKLTRAIISTLRIAGASYQWLHVESDQWIAMPDDDTDIEHSVRALAWDRAGEHRTLRFNLRVPVTNSNVDLCLFRQTAYYLEQTGYSRVDDYLALGELKGGIDPAGADEHWKTANSALERVRTAFADAGLSPLLFFIGAAIENKMAKEIWRQLENGALHNAANLNVDEQLFSIAQWLVEI